MGRAAQKSLPSVSGRLRLVQTQDLPLLPREQLRLLLQETLVHVLGSEYAETDPMLRRAKDTKTADYQANIAPGLAKGLSRDPRELAQALVDDLAHASILESVSVSGNGFINLVLTQDYLQTATAYALTDSRLGVPLTAHPQRTIIDYSGPNVAKEMHVGHLRSTIIGDALARVLAFAGHDVIRQNHLGDFGTQFGMLVENMIENERTQVTNFKDLGVLYRESKLRYDEDEEFAERARARVVALQSGDERTQNIWAGLVSVSRTHMRDLYQRLGVSLEDTDIKGESSYNNDLAKVVSELQAAGVVQTSEGALVALSQNRRNKDGSPAALIVRKSDGGYLYGTTDLAALHHRLQTLEGERLIYVVDARQSQHFELLFETAQRAHWLKADTSAIHVSFGAVLDESGHPLRTRAGQNVPLEELIDEAVVRARDVVDAKTSSLSESERETIAEAVGIGAIKYADLSCGRQRDYVFSFERALALEGNTGPYLQYARVRARAIARKAKEMGLGAEPASIVIDDVSERALALQALEFASIVDEVTDTLEPHRLCSYLYDLASAYMHFYERCPVLSASVETASSRLALSQLAAQTLAQGLELLGIAAPEFM
jgi:arginyl-tRNA synthetase